MLIELQRSLQDERRRVDELQLELSSDVDETDQALREQLQVASDRIADLERQVQQAVGQTRRLAVTSPAADAALQLSLSSEASARQQAVDALSARLAAAQAVVDQQLAQEQERRLAADADLSRQVSSSAATLTARIDQLHDELERMRSELADTDDRLAALSASVDGNTASIRAMQAEQEELMQRVVELLTFPQLSTEPCPDGWSWPLAVPDNLFARLVNPAINPRELLSTEPDATAVNGLSLSFGAGRLGYSSNAGDGVQGNWWLQVGDRFPQFGYTDAPAGLLQMTGDAETRPANVALTLCVKN